MPRKDDFRKKNERLKGSDYVPGLLSFIPFLGVFFGIFAIYKGLTAKKIGGTALAILGFLGIALSVFFFAAANYIQNVQRDLLDSQSEDLTASHLSDTVRALEFYKLQNEVYPASLQRLEFSFPDGQLFLFTYDPNIRYGTGPTFGRFYYELTASGESYYLLALGPDGLPFTADDILPSVDSKNTGLSIHPGSLR